jgi:hypothetical protein
VRSFFLSDGESFTEASVTLGAKKVEGRRQSLSETTFSSHDQGSNSHRVKLQKIWPDKQSRKIVCTSLSFVFSLKKRNYILTITFCGRRKDAHSSNDTLPRFVAHLHCLLSSPCSSHSTGFLVVGVASLKAGFPHWCVRLTTRYNYDPGYLCLVVQFHSGNLCLCCLI